MEFTLEDTIADINNKADIMKVITPRELCEINNRINSQMKILNQEFREKQNQSIESASTAFLTW
jgi:hypothetical protein